MQVLAQARRLAAHGLAIIAVSCSEPLPSLQPPALNGAPAAVTAARAPEAHARERRPRKPVMIGVLNLNRATEAELRLLPGIGKGRAAAIVARRAKRPFASLEEVARIRGLKSIVRRLRPQLSLEGETTLHPRTSAARPAEQAAAASLSSPAG